MQIQKRTLNWLPRASLYDEQANKLAKQRSNHQDFLSTQSSLASSIGDIMANNSTGESENASKAALARLKTKTA